MSAGPLPGRSDPVPASGRASRDGAVLEMAGVGRIHGRGAAAVTALAGVDLTVSAGQFVAVMGPSGSGKSTLLHLAGGLDAPTSGAVFVQGTDIGALGTVGRAALRRRHIGYVFQDFNLIPTLTAGENIALPRELDGVRRGRARIEALAALREIGLETVADRFPDALSGGQQQRVAIARALAGDRRLLLADEPTGALDSATGEAVMTLLRARADAGVAVVLVTHEARHAAWADRVVFLRDGRVVDSASADAPESLLAAGSANGPSGPNL